MAARFSGEDGHLNTGKSDFLLRNTSDELVLNRSHVDGVNLDIQSCVDRSILALFEDSTAASESKGAMEEESETLLSALTEMLDRVEEDEDQAFSPFDVLPDTEFLGRAALRDDCELSSTQRLQSKPKPPNKALITKTNGENHQECKLPMLKNQNHLLFCTKTDKKSEVKVDVFSSTSIVSLVNLMHPYCLKLHVEKEDESRRNPSLFSQEEVWRYERPTEQESDEEINVVSDEEAPAADTKQEGRLKGGGGRRLKSALLNGNPSRAQSTRERKRVSFGPVHVASFDEAEENRTSGHEKKSETPEVQTLTPDGDDNADVGQQREKKVRALSLQEYRQLRQNKRPLVEKHGDYITKWPCISETPKELTPIFCFQGQKQNPCTPKTARLHPESSSHPVSSLRDPNPAQSKPHGGRLKCSTSEPRTISPASPLPGNTPDPNVVLLESKRSPAKKQTLFNVDPPNPVLLPLPSASAAGSSSESGCSQEIHNKSSAAPSQAIASSSKSLVSPADKELNVNNTTPSEEGKPSPAKIPPARTGSAPVSQRSLKSSPSQTSVTELSQKCPAPVLSLSPPLTDVSQSPPEEASPPQTVESGIEASDLTSLLEQFEETQALKDQVCETEPKLVSASSPSNLQTDLNRPESAGSERTSRLQLEPLEEPLEPSRTSGSLSDLQTSEPADVPEPLGTEVVLSSGREPLSRRRRPPSKSIQIIDPRPLPAKKTQTGPAESSPAHAFSHLPLDHDYCGSVDYPPLFQCGRANPPPFREMSETPTELHQETRDSTPAEESKKHTSDPTTAQQRHPQQPWTCSEALPFSTAAVMEDFSPNNTQNPPSILPTPPPSPPLRGRDKRRYRGRSPHSDSSSRSSSSSSSCASCSPKRPRIRRRRSESSSSSSSCVSLSPPRCYELSRFSRSRSRSWSRSRSPLLSRSPSPQMRRRPWREVRSSRESRRLRREQEMRNQKLKAIDERRVVYVGRIRRTMTQDELSERFSRFGEVECVSLHFRDRGDHYGFVTFYNMEDAFAAIDNGGKLRKPDELPFDICFGGRRQFCNTNYADLDANRDAEPSSPRSRFGDVDFDSLLKQAQRGQKR